MLKDTIGFIGLGNMGWPMALRLAMCRKFRVVCVWNRTHKKGVDLKKKWDEDFAGQRTKGNACEIVVVSTLQEMWKICQGGSIVSMLMDDSTTEKIFTDLMKIAEKFDHDHPLHGDSTLLINCATLSVECVDRINSMIEGRRRRDPLQGTHVDKHKDTQHRHSHSKEDGHSKENGEESPSKGMKSMSSMGSLKAPSSMKAMKSASSMAMKSMSTMAMKSTFSSASMKMSTSSSSSSHLWSVHDMHFVNCSVTGRPEHAKKGELCSWVSSEREDSAEICRNYIAPAWSKAVRVISTEDATASAKFKLATNFLVYGMGQLLGETLVTFDAFNLEREGLLDWVNALMPNTLMEMYAVKLVDRKFDPQKNEPVTASLDVGVKDLSCIKDVINKYLSSGGKTPYPSALPASSSAATASSPAGSSSASGAAAASSATSKKRPESAGPSKSPIKKKRLEAVTSMSVLRTAHRNMVGAKKASGGKERDWASFLEQIEKV